MFERSKTKFRFAALVHAAVFTVVLLLVLFAQEAGPVATAMETVFGEETYSVMHEAIVSSVSGMVSPLMIMEMISCLLLAGVSLFLTVCAVRYIISKAKESKYSKHVDSEYATGRGTLRFTYKIFRQNCVMRC